MRSGWSGIDEFVAVAKAGSFTGGASALGVSTTHASRAIARLEARLDTRLFHRTTRAVSLTNTGRAFFEQCERIVTERDDAVASISERGDPHGELRLTCSTAMGERYIAPIVRQFCEQHPKLRVTIELTNRVVDLIGEGIDIGIRTGQLTDPRLTRTRIAERSLLTCASPAYLRDHGTPAAIEELMGHECLVGTATHWRFQRDGSEHLFQPHGRFQCNSGTAVVEAAVAGFGICQLPEFYVLKHLASGALVPLLDHCRPPNEPIWAVYSERRHLLPKISRFVELLKQELPL